MHRPILASWLTGQDSQSRSLSCLKVLVFFLSVYLHWDFVLEHDSQSLFMWWKTSFSLSGWTKSLSHIRFHLEKGGCWCHFFLSKLFCICLKQVKKGRRTSLQKDTFSFHIWTWVWMQQTVAERKYKTSEYFIFYIIFVLVSECNIAVHCILTRDFILFSSSTWYIFMTTMFCSELAEEAITAHTDLKACSPVMNIHNCWARKIIIISHILSRHSLCPQVASSSKRSGPLPSWVLSRAAMLHHLLL